MSNPLIVGLGNPILCDDGIGIHAVRNIKNSSDFNGYEIIEQYVGGLSLVENCLGYSKVFIIDAMVSGDEIGKIQILDEKTQYYSKYINSSHDTNLFSGFAIARQLQLDIPEKIYVLGIEVSDTQSFSEDLSQELSSRFPNIISEIKNFINNN